MLLHLKADRLDLWDLETMMARMMMMIVMQVRMLLDEGADKGLVDLQGMTAKDHAKEKECVTIIGKPHIMTIVMMMVMPWYVWWNSLRKFVNKKRIFHNQADRKEGLAPPDLTVSFL